jgi:hypothetical protein
MLTMNETIMKLSNNAAKAISAYVSADTTAGNNKTKAIDLLFAEGVRAEHLKANKGEKSELIDNVKVAIVLGFPKDKQNLLHKDVKTLSDKDKTLRREWQQRIGAKFGDIRKALLKRVESESADSDKKASWEATLRKNLDTIITQCQKKESTTIRDLNAFMKHIQSALTYIPSES